MIIKKIFYQVTKDSDWEVGVVFEDCSGIMESMIVNKEGEVLGKTFYDTREPVNERIGISI